MRISRLWTGLALLAQIVGFAAAATHGQAQMQERPPLAGRGSLGPLIDSAPDQEVFVDPELSGEFDMTTGRLAKLPASALRTFSVTLPGAHDAIFRAVCNDADTAIGRCNTGLLVTTNAGTYVNDDSPDAAALHTGAKGSSVHPPKSDVAQTYTIVAFSQIRATSRTHIDYSTDAGKSWTRLSSSGYVEAGGTLAKVGPLLAGDFLEVQTRTRGSSTGNIRMYLFNPKDTGRVARVSNGQSSSDAYARIAISDSTWQAPENFVLIGKPSSASTSNAAVETRVDLVHGPAREASVAMGSDATLRPGRYLVSIFATIEMAVGAYKPAVASTLNLSSQMPNLALCIPNPLFPGQCILEHDGCPNDDKDGLGDATWFRGQPNEYALTMILQKWQTASSAWTTVATRKIPRGAFGSAPGEGWNRFALPLKVDNAARFRVLTSNAAAGVQLFADWRYERNPAASELKVASYNAYYAPNSFSVNKYKNLADLLGTRGSILASEGRVEERRSQGPFQWEVDVLGLQEVQYKGGAVTLEEANFYTDIVRTELEARGSLSWAYAQGRGEEWTQNAGTGPGMSPVFVNSQFFPGASARSAYFSADAKAHAGCEARGGEPNWTQCHLDEKGYGDGDITNYATALKATAWRDDATINRPFTVLNVHMEASDGPKDFAPRIGELESLMAKIDKLLEADHLAFNRALYTDPDRTSPQHYQNRIMIVGDWNIRAHECGEHYWMVRKLREHYGYAIDVAMAIPDSRGSLKQGMHIGDSPSYDVGAPRGFQHWSRTDPRIPPRWAAWKDQNDYGNTAYPWWAADWRGPTSASDKVGERLSMIALVGKGWAYDDPVLSYQIMADSAHVSPMNPDGRGVEMWRNDDCDVEGSVPPDQDRSYAPSHSLGCDGSSNVHGGTHAGAPALHSDHRPMGARIRIWSR